ncbi:MAG: DmsC/YnfH family molybdoenzyme membrane anchor subunit [Tepidisphaeraceae bacterium]
MSAIASTVGTPLSLIDAYLAQQRELTAVEEFARHHDQPDHPAQPAQARYYRDLIPVSAPGQGQQYAFEVDLDACSGCKACVTACHSLNGLDDDETWRDVGLLMGGDVALPVLQHVTSACHHCIEPACMEGCPVNAYEKDAVTGIVKHLDDQCIGCQYCILKCPYDVPKYNKAKGIVRKCDMCSGRLAAGEAPACVQACPNQAIRIRVVDRSRVIEDSAANVFLPGAPEPDYTLPTTNYTTARPLPRNILPADYYEIKTENAHWPLVIMLVLTQLSVGAFVVEQALPGALQPLRSLHAIMALALGVLALGASVLHLGRPLYAFRSVIALRTSWLSREVVVFGLFATTAAVYALSVWAASDPSGGGGGGMGIAVAVTGLAGVFCSVMVYHDTRRPFWRWRFTAPKFFLTTLILGLATTLLSALAGAAWSATLTVQQALTESAPMTCRILAAAMVLKLGYGLLTFLPLRDRHHTPMKRTARLLLGPLLQPLLARYALGLLGGVLLPLLTIVSLRSDRPADCAVLIAASFLMTLAGEFIERYLFFTAVVAPKMPGGLGA